MKKIISLLLSVAVLCTGCAAPTEPPSNNNSQTTSKTSASVTSTSADTSSEPADDVDEATITANEYFGATVYESWNWEYYGKEHNYNKDTGMDSTLYAWSEDQNAMSMGYISIPGTTKLTTANEKAYAQVTMDAFSKDSDDLKMPDIKETTIGKDKHRAYTFSCSYTVDNLPCILTYYSVVKKDVVYIVTVITLDLPNKSNFAEEAQQFLDNVSLTGFKELPEPKDIEVKGNCFTCSYSEAWDWEYEGVEEDEPIYTYRWDDGKWFSLAILEGDTETSAPTDEESKWADLDDMYTTHISALDEGSTTTAQKVTIGKDKLESYKYSGVLTVDNTPLDVTYYTLYHGSSFVEIILMEYSQNSDPNTAEEAQLFLDGIDFNDL